MGSLSYLEKLQTAPASEYEKLDAEKSRRMGGVKTLYIPSVQEVANAIRSIPKGETKTIEDLREALAKVGKAETACPAKTIKYWKWMANLPEEIQQKNSEYRIPWWRVLKDGKPSRHMPGGADQQRLMLKSEGVMLE